MDTLRRGWRRFRRLPPVVQALTAFALVALYTAGIAALIGGGDSRGTPATDGARGRAEPRERNAAERAVAAAFKGAGPEAEEKQDVPALRRFVLKSVRCDGGACRIAYTVGVPGMGLILEEQRDLLERIMRLDGVTRATFAVKREKTLQDAGDPAPAEEETTSGSPLFVLSCDRAKRPEIDVMAADGGEMLRAFCTLRSADPAAQRSTSPNRKGGGGGGEGIADEIPQG